MLNDTDRRLLGRTLELASLGGRAVAPNPKVGAVIVDSDRIISEGYHAAYGGPHAEAVALEHAGSESRGGTLYCNLEPCSYSAPDKHNGPCTERIIEAGVSRVVVGQLDPNERVRGGGVAALRAAGIEVDMPNEFPDGWYENAAFNTHASLSRPFVTLKLAQSLDGKIAARGGDSKWITDEKARAEVHELRAAHDAVLVGIGTALSDNPRLTARRGATTTEQAAEEPPYPRQPLAVVLDASLQLPPDSRLVSERAHELVVLVSDAPRDHEPGPPADSNQLAARAAELTRRGVT
ncbi:MAG: bifunctional diaminohydroxyphosphoribosylaminopyrimidine deaminase/5-amino-6-(5-phosphoribosylamino)uracil reductase RibD, partial [Spirochaetia bacterium]